MSLTRWSDNQILVSNLKKTINAGSLSHAIIIESDLCVDKMQFAKDLVKAVVCREATGDGCDYCINCQKINDGNYEDLFILEGDGLSIKDGDIEELQEFLKRKSSLTFGKFAVICKADTLTVRAQNRLLKTLEEPTSQTHIILLSENVENFLDTVKSRCVIYRLNGMKPIGDGQFAELAKEIVNTLQSEGYFHKVKKLTDKKLKDRDDVSRVLDGMERIYRDFLFDVSLDSRLYRKEDVFNYIRYIEEAKKDLRFNVSPSYAFKNLILKIGG